MMYNELVELGGTDVFNLLSEKFPFFSKDVGKVFNLRYGFREILPVYSTLDAKELITNKANELSLIYGNKWEILYEKLVKDFKIGTVTDNQTTSTEKVSDENSTNHLDKVSGYDSENLVTDTGADETKTGTQTTSSDESYTGSTSTQSEREQALSGLQNKTFYDIIFTDVIVSFCGYIV